MMHFLLKKYYIVLRYIHKISAINLILNLEMQ